MGSRQFVSLALTFVLLGFLFIWAPGAAEGVDDQEQDVQLFLYSAGGSNFMHTNVTAGEDNADSVTISQGSSAYFALNLALQSDLPVNSYRTNIGFHVLLNARSSNWETGHLNIFVLDSSSPTSSSGTTLASADIDISAFISDVRSKDIPWEDGKGSEYTFDSGRYIVLQLENDGTNDVIINLESDNIEERSHLVTVTNPIRDITVLTKAYNLETSDSSDLSDNIENFKPNLPTELSKVFISGSALSAFGTYDIASFKVEVFDSESDQIFIREIPADDTNSEFGSNPFSGVVWNYNDPDKPSEKHRNEGKYIVRISAINHQAKEFYYDDEIQMDAYGIYVYTSDREQSVAIGGSVDYEIFVLNSGTKSDQFTLQPSDTSPDWDVTPESWTSSTLGAGLEESQTFTIQASDSTDMVGKSTVIVFTGKSEEAVKSETFDLETKTSVGAEYDVKMYFDDPSSGQAVSNLNTKGVAGEWNQYELTVSNEGQDTDSVQLISQDIPSDWGVEFEYLDSRKGSLTVENIPRATDGVNEVNLTVWVKPASAADNVETANIKLIGISQGNTSKDDTVILSVTRTFGLVLSVDPPGSSVIFGNKKAGEQFEIEMVLESAVEDERDIKLFVDQLPSDWSYSFKSSGATVTEISLGAGDSKKLDLFITVGSQAVYNEMGYSFYAIAQDLGDSSLISRQDLTVSLKLDSGFSLSTLKYREALKPGGSYTFQLNINNNANGEDEFTLSTSSVPSGWRVVFPNNNVFLVDAGRSVSVPIQVTVGDEAKNGDSETIVVSVFSSLVSQSQEQNFIVEVEQGFTSRLVSAFSDNWYIFVFLILIVGIGIATQYNQEEFWDGEDYSEEVSPSSPTQESSDDEWDDWD